MAPKFLRKLKKKIQKFLGRKIKYDKLTDDGTPIKDVFGNSTASPEEINFALHAENVTTFETDFDNFDKYVNGNYDDEFGNYSSLVTGTEGPNLSEQDNIVADASSLENAMNNSGQTDENWYESRRPSDTFQFAIRPRTVTSENSELGTIVLNVTEMGLEIETENNEYNSWEDVLLMDPQENLVRSWSIQLPHIRNYAESKLYFYGSNPDIFIEKNVIGSRQKMKNFIRKASHNVRQSMYNLEYAFVENNFFIEKSLLDLSKHFQ